MNELLSMKHRITEIKIPWEKCYWYEKANVQANDTGHQEEKWIRNTESRWWGKGGGGEEEEEKKKEESCELRPDMFSLIH